MRKKKKGHRADRSSLKKPKLDPLQGIVKRHPDGFGFFIPDQPDFPDVFLTRKEMTGIMANDRVMIQPYPEKNGDRFRGEVVALIERSMTKVTGRLVLMNPYQGFIRDEGHAWGDDLSVDINPGLGAKDGDWVSVVIRSHPGDEEGFTGFIDAVIGDSENPVNDNLRVLHSHDIPVKFTDETVKQAEEFPVEVDSADYTGRKDLRREPFITIDGVTAKDFDDAILVTQTGSGFNLQVAIADVSHYVHPDSPIDRDAYARGTSTYFPGFVSPMLPEALSNELCSLKPNVDRLAFVADMAIDFNGVLQSYDFYEAVINSHARVTYGQAQDVIDGEDLPEFSHVKEQVLLGRDLAKLLMARRFKEGSLVLEVPETEIEIDSSGVPIDIIKTERVFAHKLIEEMMLMANVAVAMFFEDKKTPALFRVHEEPKSEALDVLEGFLQQFGFIKGIRGGMLQKKISKALEHFSGQPQENVLNMLVLRSMKQAKYDTDNIGHFGLAFSSYSHFTSPIRRYPDLIVHRTLKALVHPKQGYELMSEADLATAGEILSGCEQRSVKAERQLHAIKKARFLSQFIGQEFNGIISSTTKFGVFVILRQFDVDGLVKVEELGGDSFEFDEQTLSLVGKNSGKAYCIGDQLRVTVASTDIDMGRIDFVLSDQENNRRDSDKPEKTKSSKKRRSTKADRSRVRKTRVSKSRRKG